MRTFLVGFLLVALALAEKALGFYDKPYVPEKIVGVLGALLVIGFIMAVIQDIREIFKG